MSDLFVKLICFFQSAQIHRAVASFFCMMKKDDCAPEVPSKETGGQKYPTPKLAGPQRKFGKAKRESWIMRWIKQSETAVATVKTRYNENIHSTT